MVRKVVRMIPAGEFKANCPSTLAEIDRDGIEVVVTKRGVPVARLRPIVSAQRRTTGEGTSMSSRTARNTTTVSAAEFKARCLALFDDVAELGQEVVVTKHGRELARVGRAGLTPAGRWPFRDLSVEFGTIGDVVTPLDVGWEALR